MAKDKPRLTRLAAILTQLQSKKIVTARDIAEKHDISIRTVYRDIRTLEHSGIPIVTEEGKGYSILDGYNLPPVMFSEEEANALITAEKIINKNKDASLVQHYINAVEKLKAVMRSNQKVKSELLTERIHIRNNKFNLKTSDYLVTLQSAVTNYKIVHLEYESLHNHKSNRDVEPFALFSTNENWLLIAYCRNKTAFRAFRLDCIEKLIVKDETFEPHKMTLQEYFEECKRNWLNTPDTPLTPDANIFAIKLKKLNMQKLQLDGFTVVGIKIKTTNENAQSSKDIPAMWDRFMKENIVSKIPNRVDDTVYAIYTNYEGHYMKPYDTILGCKVSSTDDIPKGMYSQAFEAKQYAKFTCKGDVTQGAVYDAWTTIWNAKLDRQYYADFEVYGKKSINPKDAEIDIFVSIKG